MTEVAVGDYASVTASVAEEKTREKKSPSWLQGVIRKECGGGGKCFGKTRMEAQKSAIGRQFKT